MNIFKTNKMSISLDYNKCEINSIIINNNERLHAKLPLFKISFLDKSGDKSIITAYDAILKENGDNFAIYNIKSLRFENYLIENLQVEIHLSILIDNEDIMWKIDVKNIPNNVTCEYVDFPNLILPDLNKNNYVLYPYNEGVIINDINEKERSIGKYEEPIYPSKGSYGIFPNMVFAQFISYHFNDCGIYFGLHDVNRGLKGIDICPNSNGVAIKLRLFTGCNFGEDYIQNYYVIISCVDSDWESSAEKYRNWFESNLPNGVKKIVDNDKLPSWYKDMPLVVSYPIRGTFDMDVMTENAFYPYTNALPTINSIKDKTDSKILVLLMHWEGTAPWAPPYVWPPYGDFVNFKNFRDSLKNNSDLLGVYCSGFGYTIKSNLIPKYDRSIEYENENLSKGMCTDAKGNINSVICQGQRKSYDICPTSPVGKKILDKAYKPLFESGLDYVQILDQNHGGGQYLCYSKEHNHPPVPGVWMTDNMSNLLSSWNEQAPNMLFGCESSAAEPYIGNLLFSDNRFELNYAIGQPITLYSYIYHEYLHNFMGNQVNCPFNGYEDSYVYRLAHSFVAGDSLTITLSPNGEILPNWGFHYDDNANDKEKILSFIKTLTSFYKKNKSKYLYNGKRIKGLKVDCDTVVYSRWNSDTPAVLPAILSAAYLREDGKKVQILVNPLDFDANCKLGDKNLVIPKLNVIEVEI